MTGAMEIIGIAPVAPLKKLERENLFLKKYTKGALWEAGFLQGGTCIPWS